MFVAYTILLLLVMAGLYTERGCITVPVLADAQANLVPAFVADRQTIDSQGTPGNPWLTGIYDDANEIPKGVNSDGIPPPIAVPLSSRGLTGVNLTPTSQLSPSATTRGFQSSQFDNSLLLAPRSTIVDSPNASGFNAQADRSRREDAAENRLLGITP
jgi:hypothetical protein